MMKTSPPPTRREFLRTAAAGSALAVGGLGCSSGGSSGVATPPASPQPVRPLPPAPAAEKKGKTMLILGGTGFLGPAVVEAAQARGFTLTLFNRGKTNPGLFPDVEKLHGDRDGKLGELEGRSWDAAIDTSGYVPRVVKMSADLLAGATQHYVFISTISVYASMATAGMDESTPVATIADEKNEDVGTNYGALKALCEKAAETAMPGRVTNIRPGLIVGPRDPTGRFTYWPVRVERGGEILAPGTGSDPVQYIDVRDLAEWIVKVVEARTMGVFNALGPAERLEMKRMLTEMMAAVGSTGATLTWVPAEFLDKYKVKPWMDMPVWVPSQGDEAGAGAMSNARAVAAGLSFRTVADSTKATVEWLRGLDADTRAKVTQGGLLAEREKEVLAAWRKSHKK